MKYNNYESEIKQGKNLKHINLKSVLIISVMLFVIIIIIIIIMNLSNKYINNIEITPKESYGKVVDNYNAQGLEWRIFYSDDDNVYLISKETVFSDTLLSGLILNEENNEFDYTLLENDTINFPAGKKWFSGYLNSDYISSGEYDNTIAILYMLNSNYWKKYVDENYADWAIGGPTLEMFCASVNIGTDLFYKVDMADSARNRLGILEELDKGDTCGYAFYSEDGNLPKNTMWYRNEKYWLASPSWKEGIFYINSDGKLSNGDYTNYTNTYGCRPIVCLKSNVALKSNGNGTYSITLDNKNTVQNEITGIEQAINDGMIGKDYITEGVTESKLKSVYYDGNLQLYYDSWDKCLEDAKKLNIIVSDK